MLIQDNFGSTGTFYYDFEDFSQPSLQRSPPLVGFDDLTTPRLPVLPPPPVTNTGRNPGTLFQAPPSQSNSYIPPLSPESAPNSYASPQAPPIMEDQITITRIHRLRTLLGLLHHQPHPLLIHLHLLL